MESPIQKWEYKIIERFHDVSLEQAHATLNALGQEGWELVAVAGSAVDGRHIAYFKRRA